MDNSKEYILMCEKATEIQKTMCIPVEKPYIYSDKYPSILCYGADFVCMFNNTTIWLPRQDQLQDMMWDKNAESDGVTQEEIDNDYFCLMEQVFRFRDDCVLDDTPIHSMEQLWLAFVMKEKYDKIWNGEDWV